MPEGPSIVILKEAVQSFKGKKIKSVGGSTKKIDISLLKGQTILDFKSWGKHFLICFKDFTVRIHFLLYGSYRINEQRELTPRLHLGFSKGELNFYACSIMLIEHDLDEVYDWSSDVMNPSWDAKAAKKKLKKHADLLACDALLSQTIFSGVGNIIKNEVLYRIKVHPESTVSVLPPKKLNEMIKEAVTYSFQFLEWKKAFELKKHFLAHTKSLCLRCNLKMVRKQHLGKFKRRAFYCTNCQVLYK